MKAFFCKFVLMLSVSIFFSSSCFGMTAGYRQSQELINFLDRNNYLSGSRDILIGEHIEYISEAIERLGVNGIINNLPTGSFVTNIAFAAAQVHQIDIAAQLLMILHRRGNSNWLLDDIRQMGKRISQKSIKAALIESYDSIWRQQEELRRQRHGNGVED